jgi:hypothetical protein
MSIVPDEVVQDIRETWPARDMGLLEYAAERGAEWALEQAAQVCDAVAVGFDSRDLHYNCSGAEECAEAIRARITGGESDEN